MRPNIGIVGAGKVGQTLARIWHDAGYDVVAVYSRSVDKAAALADRVDAVTVASASAVVAQADLTVLSVPDDVIQAVAAQIMVDTNSQKAIIHNSGAHSVDVLDAVAAQGAWVGSLHPAFPFADVDAAMQGLKGATFALEASDVRLGEWLTALVEVVGGRPLMLPPGAKAAYHAALVLASNYTVTLYAAAQRLLLATGADPEAVDGALGAILSATVANISEVGIPAALTGPLLRADGGTITAHLAAINDVDTLNAYRALAMLTVPLLHARGTDPAFINQLDDLLAGDTMSSADEQR